MFQPWKGFLENVNNSAYSITYKVINYSHSIDAQFETHINKGMQRDKNDCVKYVSLRIMSLMIESLSLKIFSNHR